MRVPTIRPCADDCIRRGARNANLGNAARRNGIPLNVIKVVEGVAAEGSLESFQRVIP